MMRRLVLRSGFVKTLLASVLLAFGGAQSGAQDAATAVDLADPRYVAGAAILDSEFERTVDETILLTEIPAPPFGEDKRAEAYLAMFRDAGFADAARDEEGNVLALLPSGAERGPVIVVSAHIDTVFPIETDVTVTREGDRLTAPGVGDDTRNLAVILAYARAMKESGLRTATDILFVGTVGEEGPGDLRGVRHLMTKGEYAGRVKAFLSFDGLDPEEIIASAVGSRRYRTTFRGPGGHSFSDFGMVNPMGAMARTVEELYALEVPSDPPTSYAASMVSGGRSINSIPDVVELQVDLRSFSPEELARLDREYLAATQRAVVQENARRSVAKGELTVENTLIGDRPAGGGGGDSAIAQTALAAYSAHGFAPEFSAASTDSNIAMSLGIPALTLGSGGTEFGAHSLDEYIELPREDTFRGMRAGYAAVLALAGSPPEQD